MMIDFDLESTEQNARILLDGMWYMELPELLDRERLYDNLMETLGNMVAGNVYESYQMDAQQFITDFKNIDSPSYLRRPGVEPVTYYEFKNNKYLREMQIPNLIHYMSFIYNSLWIFADLFEKLYCDPLYKKYVDNSNSYVVLDEMFYIQKQYEEDEEVLLGVFTNKNNKAQGNAIMSSNRVRYENIAEAYLYGLKMDVESFFPNIYTHYFDKISDMKPFDGWNDARRYFKFLDVFYQRINNNQTKGIPAGTFSAHIAAELCMLCVDAKVREKIGTEKIGYIRYVDDLTFFADSQEVLNKAEMDTQKVLNEFRLRINGNKTNVFKNAVSRQLTNIEEIIHKLSFLFANERFIFTVNEIQRLKEYIASLIETERMSQVKTVLTKLRRCIDTGSVEIKYVHRSLFCYLLTLLFEDPNLAVHCYRILDVLLQKDSRRECYDILNRKTELVDDKYSETLLQIWHYYVLAKYLDKRAKTKFFNDHVHKLKNPIIYSFFVEEGVKVNSHIVGKIKDAYLLEENDSGWRKKIIYSRWWLPLSKIKMVDGYNYENIFNKAYFPKVLEDMLK